MRHSTAAREGVTLLEMMIVVGVLALLVGILLPVLAGSKESAAEVRSLANLRSIGQTLLNFQAVSNDEFPFYNAGDHLYSFPESIGTDYAISFTPHWQFRSYWAAHPTIHRIAPWASHYDAWLSPGAEAHPDLRLWQTYDGEAIVWRRPSYHYANGFIGDPRVWTDDPPAWEDAPKRIRAGDVRSPSAKVVFWDAERAYLRPYAGPDDPRPVLFADGSAHLRLDDDATPPVANPYWPMLHVYNDTPSGVLGRDF